MIHSYLSALEREARGGDRVQVLVTKRNVAAGAALLDEDVAVRDVPASCVDERRVLAKEKQSALGVPVTTALSTGAGLLWSDLTSGESRGKRLSSLVTEGRRIVSVTHKSSTFDGLLEPGDRVDVLLTTTEQGAPVATPLLENLLVLSVGGALPGASDAGKRSSGDSVALSVTTSEALVLTAAESRGRLRLILRNPSDLEVQPPAPQPPKSAPPRASARAPREIEHVR